MKKLLAITFLVLFATTSYVSARTVYDSTGRHIIHDDTIRGQRKEKEMAANPQRQQRAAAAARIDYDKAMRDLDRPKSNFYQDQVRNRY